jgi:FixJ family two-component response regulator
MEMVDRFTISGLAPTQGAQKMQISLRTFESHRAEMMHKLGARNTADLVRTALRLSNDQGQ